MRKAGADAAKTAAACPPADLRDTEEPAANERAWLRACQVEVGSRAFKRTARTEEEEEEEGSPLLPLQPKSCAAPGREKQRRIVSGRREGKKERSRLRG